LYDAEPWDGERDELLHGIACSLISSCHADKVKAAPPLDFMPYEKQRIKGKKPLGQNQKEMKAVAGAIVSAMEKSKQRTARLKKNGK
jgi:hypothetical protein